MVVGVVWVDQESQQETDRMSNYFGKFDASIQKMLDRLLEKRQFFDMFLVNHQNQAVIPFKPILDWNFKFRKTDQIRLNFIVQYILID